MTERSLLSAIIKNCKQGFINLIYGPRKIGKTLLLEQLRKKIPAVNRAGWFDGNTRSGRETLNITSEVLIDSVIGNFDTIFIDEAQQVANISIFLKIMVERFPQKQFFVTASSFLSLNCGAIEYRLYPVRTKELATVDLENQLRFGGYPHLIELNSPEEKQTYLQSIVEDSLLKDVSLLKRVASPENLKKLAILLAFKIGEEVSLNDLARSLGIDVKTVSRYLSLLKQSFIIFEVGTLAKKIKEEIATGKKYYFWDLGIRNALINQFFSFSARTDVNQLWENFLAIERLAKNEEERKQKQYFFWRTYNQAKIDWVEIEEEILSAYQFNWQNQKAYTPKLFKENYQQEAQLISKENYLKFVE